MAPFKLYYTSTSCGAASYIVASLAGVDFDSEQVDLRAHKTQSGADFYAINPNGSVPTVVLEDGSVLAQNVATLTYIADRNPSANLAPAAGTAARYQYLDRLGFVNSELHTSFGKLFNPALSEADRVAATKVAKGKAKFFVEHVLKGDFVLGSDVSAADVYAYIVFSWAPFLKLDLSEVAGVDKFSARVKAVAGVVEAHEKMNAATSK